AEVRSSATALAFPPRRGITSPATFPAAQAATRAPPAAPGRVLRHRTPAVRPRAVPSPTCGRSAEARPTRTPPTRTQREAPTRTLAGRAGLRMLRGSSRTGSGFGRHPHQEVTSRIGQQASDRRHHPCVAADQVAGPWTGAGQGLLDDFGHPGGRHAIALLHVDALPDPIDRPLVAAESFRRKGCRDLVGPAAALVPDRRADGARLDQYHLDPRWRQLVAEGLGDGLQGEFG